MEKQVSNLFLPTQFIIEKIMSRNIENCLKGVDNGEKQVPTTDKEESEQIPDADEIQVAGTEAIGVEAFHDGSTVTRCCANTPHGCRAIYLSGKSVAAKTRFVLVSSMIGGVAGIMAFTLTTNPMYYLHASGCDSSSPYFLNANRTEDTWRISPAFGICPDSGRVTVCESLSNDEDDECYIQYLHCLNFSNATAWQFLDEMNAAAGYESNLNASREVWLASVNTLNIGAILIMSLGMAAIVGDVILSKVVLTPLWNILRYVIRSTCLPPRQEAASDNPANDGRANGLNQPGEMPLAFNENDLSGWEEHSHLFLVGESEEAGGREETEGAATASDTPNAASATCEDGVEERPPRTDTIENWRTPNAINSLDYVRGGDLELDNENLHFDVDRREEGDIPTIIPPAVHREEGTEVRPRLVSLEHVSVREEDIEERGEKTLSERLSFGSGSSSRRKSHEYPSRKEIPIAENAREMAIAQVEVNEEPRGSIVERCLDLTYEDIVGKQWPFFKFTCLIQIVTFILVSTTTETLKNSEIMDKNAWTSYLFYGCQEVTFEESSYYDYFIFVQVVSMFVFLIMFIHLLFHTQAEGSCLRVCV